MRTVLGSAALAVLALPMAATAGAFADHAAIDRAIEGFTGSPIGNPGGASLPVDRRLRLANCGQPLALEWYGNAADTVLVRCPTAGGWRIYVPVQAAAVASAGRREAPVEAAPPEDVVKRGETVTVSISGSGFTLSRQAEALDSGAIGEWIRVRPAGRNMDPFRARITRPGQVGMDLP